jgi:hypothetical protein
VLWVQKEMLEEWLLEKCQELVVDLDDYGAKARVGSSAPRHQPGFVSLLPVPSVKGVGRKSGDL